MRIGIVVDNEFNNDIRVRNEALALQKAGHNVSVLCFEFGSNLGNEYQGIDIERWKLKPKYKNILFALFHFINIYSLLWSIKIKKFIKSKNIDALHIHDLYMSRSGYLATKRFNIPLILDLHENYAYAVDDYLWMHKSPAKYIVQPNKWKKIEGKYLSYPNKIIALSDSFKSYLIDKYNFLSEDNIIVYTNAPDVSVLSSYSIDKKILPKNKFTLFYFGGISKRRGVYLAIDSLKELKKQIPNIQLLLIGPVDKAEQEKFNKAISATEVKDNIVFYPWKDISLLPSFIVYSDICLSPIEKNPQHESGIANKVFQYMLFERPVLVSDCGPQAKVINDEKAGLVHQWDSVKDFSEKVLLLYKDQSLAKKMGVNGRNAVINKYNQENLIKPMINFYTKI